MTLPTSSIQGHCHVLARSLGGVRHGGPWNSPRQNCKWYAGLTLKWVSTYLAKRSFRVHFPNQQSSSVPLKCGIFTWFSLGPLLFIIYLPHLADMVIRHDCTLKTYAEEIQFNIHCQYRDVRMAASKIKSCIAEITGWPLTGWKWTRWRPNWFDSHPLQDSRSSRKYLSTLVKWWSVLQRLQIARELSGILICETLKVFDCRLRLRSNVKSWQVRIRQEFWQTSK